MRFFRLKEYEAQRATLFNIGERGRNDVLSYLEQDELSKSFWGICKAELRVLSRKCIYLMHADQGHRGEHLPN